MEGDGREGRRGKGREKGRRGEGTEEEERGGKGRGEERGREERRNPWVYQGFSFLSKITLFCSIQQVDLSVETFIKLSDL